MPVSYELSFCANCLGSLPDSVWQNAEISGCPLCGRQVFGVTFPALSHEPPVAAKAEELASPDEASCFAHSGKRAVAACDQCGRFVCSLCHINWGGRPLCPNCVLNGTAAPKDRRSLGLLEKRRVLYDSIALGTALLPVALFPMFYIGFVTAPAAIYFAIRYWRASASIVPRTRIRLYAALAIATAELGGLFWFVFYMIAILPRRR